MAAFTYSDWESESTTALRLARLKLHIQEVVDTLANPQAVGSSSHNMSKFDLTEYLKDLRAERARIESATAAAGGLSRLRFRRASS